MTHIALFNARRRIAAVRMPILAAFVLVSACIAGCGGSDSTAPDPPASAGATAEIVVTPNTSSLAVGSTLPLQAQAKNASGEIMGNVTIFWSSSDTTVATVSSAGVVTAKAPGSAQIAASAGGKSAVATLTVVTVPVATVAVLPDTGTVILGSTLTLKAVTYDSGRNVLTGRQITWSSGAPKIASVDGNGVVTGVATGTAIISAASEGKTATATITVNPAKPPGPAPVASVRLNPSSAIIAVGASQAITATTLDSHGNTLTGRSVTWQTSDATVATVANGRVTGVAPGTATITATSEGKSATATITVQAAPPAAVDRITLVPDGGLLRTITVHNDGTVTLTAHTYDASGNELTGRAITWSTDDNRLAAVKSTGAATALVTADKKRTGFATITATSEGKHVSVTIWVVK